MLLQISVSGEVGHAEPAATEHGFELEPMQASTGGDRTLFSHSVTSRLLGVLLTVGRFRFPKHYFTFYEASSLIALGQFLPN